MLPAESRMRRQREFSDAVRRGSRSGRGLLTGHLFRAVGGAVVRNRVRRRLRVLVREYLSSLPGGSLLVVRAHPQAATASQADLAAELDLVMSTLVRRQAGALRR